MVEAVRPTEGTAIQPGLPGRANLPPGEAVRRILLTSGWFGAIATLAAWTFLGWHWALGFAGGALIGAANLIFLSVLARLVLVAGRKNLPSILAVVTIKVLAVYGGLAALLLWRLPPTLAVVCGFSLVLVVITLKAAGRAVLSYGWLKSADGDREDSLNAGSVPK